MASEALMKDIGKLLDKKLNPISKLLDELKAKVEKIEKIEESICFLSSKYDELFTKTISLESQNEDLKKENQYLVEKLQSSANELDQVKLEVNDLQQYSRRDCLEIRGIPYIPNEKTNEIIQKIGNEIGVPVTPDDISISHRLSARQNYNQNGNRHIKEPAIIAKFVYRSTRDDFYNARKFLRDKTSTDIGITRMEGRRIFIVESLTQQNKKLFNNCLQIKKESKYKFIWTVAGKIYLRKDENSPAINISTWKDLKKIQREVR